MDIKHTKEPWNAIPANSAWHTGKDAQFQDGCWYILPREDYERTPIAMIDKTNDLHATTRKQAEYDAKRIVECVNACAGIPTEMLEEVGTLITPNALNYQQLIIQRDELLAALKGLIEFADPYFDKDGFGYVGKLETAKKCIAKAEGRF